MGFYLNSAAPGALYKSETENPYFVDKSQLLEELIPFVQQGNKHICITRPRRFGKTVMANMIGAFFGKGSDTQDIFDTLQISASARSSCDRQISIKLCSAPHFHRKCGALFDIMSARRGMFSFDTKREPEKCQRFRRAGATKKGLLAPFNPKAEGCTGKN